MSENGQVIRLSGVINVGNHDQAQAIYVVLAALGWHGGVHMVVTEGDVETQRTLDTSEWGIA